MSNLQQRQKRIKSVKKNNTYRDFLMELVSRYPLMIYKNSSMLSLYPDTNRCGPLISTMDFERERDSYTQYGLEYDLTINFFENYKKLHHIVPFPALFNRSGAENSNYAFGVYMSKNCYLSFTVITDCENILYSFAVKENCKNVYNSSQIRNNNQNIYTCVGVFNSSDIYYSRYITDCYNIRFSTNMVWCQNCLFCDGLTNQSYCIRNIPYNKEEYEIEKRKLLWQKDKFDEYHEHLSRIGQNYGSNTVTGEFVLKSQDVQDGHYVLEVSWWQNLLMVWWSHLNTDMYDVFEAWAHGNHDFYGAMDAGIHSEHLYNCDGIVTCSNIYYSRFLENCQYCFGCIGLKNKSYCILNKQYTKEDRYEKVEAIFSQMERDWILWKFFPASANPFYFNDTIAYFAWNFTKEEIIAKWYLWRDEPIKVDIPEGTITVKSSELGQFESTDEQGNRRLNETVCKRVILDENWDAYRIIPMELEFLQKHGLPLPRKHWLTRMKENFRID